MPEDIWDEIPNIEEFQFLVGKSHTFEDGDSITVIQIKRRDSGIWVTYHVQQGPGIPRKLLMHIGEFLETFGHLLGYQAS